MTKIKTNRSTARLAAVQALYLYAFGNHTIDVVVRDFLSGNIGTQLLAENKLGTEVFVPMMPCDPTLFSKIMDCYAEKSDQINEMIDSSLAENYSKERVDMTLRAILQAGIAELLSCPETPKAIIVSEYVDLTLCFYTGPESKVSNGILDKLAHILRES